MSQHFAAPRYRIRLLSPSLAKQEIRLMAARSFGEPESPSGTAQAPGSRIPVARAQSDRAGPRGGAPLEGPIAARAPHAPPAGGPADSPGAPPSPGRPRARRRA